MKAIKLFAATAAALALLASCQKQKVEAPDSGAEQTEVTLQASFGLSMTKVSYTEIDEHSNFSIQPKWEKYDTVIGFDNEGKDYTFTVTDVDTSTGKATLNGKCPASCTLHLIYLNGAEASEIQKMSLPVSYADQAGDKTMPAVMLADGKVEYGTGDFHFTNAGAVIGVSAVKGVPKGAVVSKITVSGENLSEAIVELNGKTLALVPQKSGDSITITPAEGLTVKDDNGTLSSPNPILIAVPAEAKVSKVSATTDKGYFFFTLASPSTLFANQYSYVKNQTFTEETHLYVEIGGKKWATMNIGATTVAGVSLTCYGWHFFWGGTTGYVHDGSKWVTADGGVELSGGFCWKNTPFNNGSSNYDGTYFSAHKLEWLDGNDTEGYTLKPEYDAAHVNWGGEWRMPKTEDFINLIKACGGSTATSELTSSDPGKGIYWVSAEQTYISEYTGVAGLLFCDDKGNKLFFPAAGYGDGASLNNAGSHGYYWSSCIDSSKLGSAFLMDFISSSVSPDTGWFRYIGQSVRPVSD